MQLNFFLILTGSCLTLILNFSPTTKFIRLLCLLLLFLVWIIMNDIKISFTLAERWGPGDHKLVLISWREPQIQSYSLSVAFYRSLPPCVWLSGPKLYFFFKFGFVRGRIKLAWHAYSNLVIRKLRFRWAEIEPFACLATVIQLHNVKYIYLPWGSALTPL